VNCKCSRINTAGRLIQARLWTATLLCMRRPFALATQLLRSCPRILTSRCGCCRSAWQGTRRARAERVFAGARPPLHARMCRRRARLLTRRGTPTWRGWPTRGRSTRASRCSCRRRLVMPRTSLPNRRRRLTARAPQKEPSARAQQLCCQALPTLRGRGAGRWAAAARPPMRRRARGAAAPGRGGPGHRQPCRCLASLRSSNPLHVAALVPDWQRALERGARPPLPVAVELRLLMFTALVPASTGKVCRVYSTASCQARYTGVKAMCTGVVNLARPGRAGARAGLRAAGGPRHAAHERRRAHRRGRARCGPGSRPSGHAVAPFNTNQAPVNLGCGTAMAHLSPGNVRPGLPR